MADRSSTALDLGGVWARARRDARESWRGAMVGAFLLGALGAVAGIFVPSNEPWWTRALLAAGAFVVAFVALAAIVYCVRVLNAPLVQRDEARLRADELEQEIARRDAIELSLEFDVEVLSESHPFVLGPPDSAIPFTKNVAFWVRVINHGPTAVFAAQLLNVSGLPDREGNVRHDGVVEEVAWENTVDALKVITPGGRARLRLGNLARSPSCIGDARLCPAFWFILAESATWSPGQHAHGWRYNPPWTVNRSITFDLVVTDTTHDHARVQGVKITFGGDDDAPSLVPVGDLRVFDIGFQE